MTYTWTVSRADIGAIARIAGLVALKIRPGDTLGLSGDLGAGKTTLARALIRALQGDEAFEVPSPTFAILQTYETPRLTVSHADFYRLRDASEIGELGVRDLVATGALVAEWPERAPGFAGDDHLEIALAECGEPDYRNLALTGHGYWQPRLERLAQIQAFLSSQPAWRECRISYLQGDASARAYARLSGPASHAILMDAPRQPDGPQIRDGLPYSRIAHLAEDVRPFVAIARHLKASGFSTPEIFAGDLDAGLLILEDLGDRVFGQEVARGASLRELWGLATETLVALAELPVPDAMLLPDGSSAVMADLDRPVLVIETELLLDWYWPAALGTAAPLEARLEFGELWEHVFGTVLAGPKGWMLRDYHSPNLIHLPDRNGIARTGIIDFQDALKGPPAFDLVSLLQDARLGVPEAIERELFEHYCALRSRQAMPFDREAFAFAYAALGAERNTKILGIFARLARRDGKPGYLAHIPRIWRYLERDLAHPGLQALRGWYDRHFPPHLRSRVLDA